ncbi:MAG: TldD/PmbA family protein [Crenarchaeota archaeon]|nr:TldD/PmbA family protein [Thermoproteota archaeon]
MFDILDRAVNLARELGASYAEARYHELVSTQIMTRNGQLLGISGGVQRGVAIRVMYRGILSFASTNSCERSSVEKAVEIAVSRAKALSSLAREPPVKELAPARVGRARYAVVPEKPLDSMPVDEKISMLKELFRVASSSCRECKLATLSVVYSETIERKIVLNSDGGYIESEVPRPTAMLNIVLVHPQRGTLQRMIELGGSGGLEIVRGWALESMIRNEVEALDRVLSKGIEPPKEPIPVVLGSEVVGLIVHESCGHPLEADRIWGREAAQAGESFAKRHRIGDTIGNEHATVIDDPTIPKSFGFYLYDDECVAARPKYLYREGRINELIHNRWSAALYNVESNGSARARDFRSEPIPRMSNTYLAPGDHRFEELIEDIKLGLYVKSYMEWNIDDERWGQRYVGLEAYVIRNGELAEPVLNPVLEFTTPSFYSSIEAKGREVRFYAALCGKGEPPQGIPVWFGGPDVRLKKMVVGVAR